MSIPGGGTHVVGPLPDSWGWPAMAIVESTWGGVFLGMSIFIAKNEVFGVETLIILVFLCIFSLRTSLTSAKRVRGRFWSLGKAYMSSNRRAFQAQLGSRDPKLAQETPRRPPQEGLKNNCFFFKKKKSLPCLRVRATCSPHPGPL